MDPSQPGDQPRTSPRPPVRPEPTDAGASETEGWWPAPPEIPHEPFNSRRRWTGRLAFPLLVVAVLLAWQGVQVSEQQPSPLPRWAWWTLAALSTVVGLIFIRARHR